MFFLKGCLVLFSFVPSYSWSYKAFYLMLRYLSFSPSEQKQGNIKLQEFFSYQQ